MSRHFPMRWAGSVLGGRLVLTAARSHRAQAPRIPPAPPSPSPPHPPTNSPCPSLICNPSSTAKIILSAPPYISFERCAYHHHHHGSPEVTGGECRRNWRQKNHFWFATSQRFRLRFAWMGTDYNQAAAWAPSFLLIFIQREGGRSIVVKAILM